MKIVAIVTGANQGLGKGIVWNLLQRLSASADNNHHVVYLGSRNAERGKAAVQELQQRLIDETTTPAILDQTTSDSNNVSLRFLQIDVTSDESVKAAADQILSEQTTQTSLDNNNSNNDNNKKKNNLKMIFIHNAAARMNPNKKKQEQVEEFINTNNRGTHRVIKSFGPLMKEYSKDPPRFLIIASSFGSLTQLQDSTSTSLRSYFASKVDTTMTLEELEIELDKYTTLTQQGMDVSQGGWPDWMNIPSKIMQVAAMRIFAREYRRTTTTTTNSGSDFFVAAICPGLVQTEASRPFFDAIDFAKAPTPEQASKPIVDLALGGVDGVSSSMIDDHEIYGELIRAPTGKIIPWK